MEISHVLIDAIWRPHFLFKYPALQANLLTSAELTGNLPWDASPLNPKNRINSLNETTAWRVDGATICGTTFFVVPTCLLRNLVPLRLDLFVPDQNAHPVHLRDVLDSSLSVPLRDLKMISRLGISRHLCVALDSYCRRHPTFLEEYSRLPFGSRLVFDKIEVDVNQMDLVIIPWREVERQSKSLAALQKLWEHDIPQEAWPEAVALDSLRLVEQLHDSISVVNLASSPDQMFAFKSSVENLEFLYHELKFLLTIPPHPNIMRRPLYVVTKRSSFGGKHGVVGFILPFYPLGSIRDLLPAGSQTNTLAPQDKLSWCIQITSALIHIQEEGDTFYSDLRPDNVLLATVSDTQGQLSKRVVLCDFEQRGNWHEWCAPEILYRQYIVNMQLASRNTEVPDHWQKLINAYTSNTDMPRNVVEAKNIAWFSLSPASQEKAMVYTLGLFIYCVFEGVSNVRVNIANAYRHDPDVEFPVFCRTPPAIQKLIRLCTVDAPEWPENVDALMPPRAQRVIRIRDKLYGAKFQTSGNVENVKEDVLHTGLKWWTTELERAGNFLQSEAWKSQVFGSERPTLRSVLFSLEHVKLLLDT